MSRTFRNKRPSFDLGDDSGAQEGHKIYKCGKVRDGTAIHATKSCNNHGGCPYCEGNKMHHNRKREPIIIEEEYDEVI